MSKEKVKLVGGVSEFTLVEYKDCQFDSVRDLHRVEPCSILLLSEVLANGVVPPDTTDMDFNEIEDPNNIAGRVTNVFDAIDLSNEIAKSNSNASVLKPAPAVDPSEPSAKSSSVSLSVDVNGNSTSTPNG